MFLHTSNNRGTETQRGTVATRLSTRKYGDTPAMENITYTLYKPGELGTANNMRIEELNTLPKRMDKSIQKRNRKYQQNIYRRNTSQGSRNNSERGRNNAAVDRSNN